jgi:hypothetical protein
VRLEGLDQLKNPMTLSGLKPATFRLASQCVNQLLYRVPPYFWYEHDKENTLSCTKAGREIAGLERQMKASTL